MRLLRSIKSTAGTLFRNHLLPVFVKKDARVPSSTATPDAVVLEMSHGVPVFNELSSFYSKASITPDVTPAADYGKDSFQKHYPDLNLEDLPRTTDFSRSALFKESVVYRPFAFPWAIELWERHENVHWTKTEASVAGDVEDWNSGRLTEEWREYVTQFLRFFVQSDTNVGGGYKILGRRIQNNQINMWYNGAANREGTHQVNYANVIDTLNLPESEYREFLEHKEMMEKHEFMLDLNVDTVEEFALSVARMICSEGITLFGSFISLLSFKANGLMKGMGVVIEWSIRDEELHVEGHTKVWHEIMKAYPEILTDAFKQRMYLLYTKCVELEERFIDRNFDICGDLPNLTREQAKHHVRFLANRRLLALGMKELFPDIDSETVIIPWLTPMIQGEQHANFFENRSTEYSADGIKGYPQFPRETPEEILIYTRDGCGFCTKAKDLLDDLDIPYQQIDLTDFDRRMAFFEENGFGPDVRRLPQIYEIVSEGQGETRRHVGGYTDLENESQLYTARCFAIKSVVPSEVFTEADISIT